MLVVDASAAFNACAAPDGFDVFGSEALVGPPLLWSEVSSTVHEAMWRGEISREQATTSLERLESGRIRVRPHAALRRQAWLIADQLGWAKTYDAEYIALARLLRCRLVTLDERLRRSAGRFVEMVVPLELKPP